MPPSREKRAARSSNNERNVQGGFPQGFTVIVKVIVLKGLSVIGRQHDNGVFAGGFKQLLAERRSKSQADEAAHALDGTPRRQPSR